MQRSLCQESFRIMKKGMQELKRLQAIVIASVVGVVISFGGAIFTVYRTNAEKQSQMLPENQIPVPATAQ